MADRVSEVEARKRSACPNCGSTEWTIRAGLRLPRVDGLQPRDVCNVCSPAKPRPKKRWWRRQRTVNVWVWRLLWACIYLNALASVTRLVRHFGG